MRYQPYHADDERHHDLPRAAPLFCTLSSSRATTLNPVSLATMKYVEGGSWPTRKQWSRRVSDWGESLLPLAFWCGLGGTDMRSAFFLAVGLVIGAGLQGLSGQQRNIVSLNHVAIAVDDFAAASRFYSQGMGFPEAFALREPNGSPALSYFQINRNTFIDLMPVTAERPAGFVHFGLEVTSVDEVVRRLRATGMTVGDPGTSPRTKSRIAVARTPQGTSLELLEFGPDSLHRKVIDAWK
jgi:catechol 2,3-dioxygenase-like lactoylglutathione lyase family enzyme